jgi:hypothetical protein
MNKQRFHPTTNLNNKSGSVSAHAGKEICFFAMTAIPLTSIVTCMCAGDSPKKLCSYCHLSVHR